MRNIIKFKAWADAHVHLLYHERSPFSILLKLVIPEKFVISPNAHDTDLSGVSFIGSFTYSKFSKVLADLQRPVFVCCLSPAEPSPEKQLTKNVMTS